MHFCLTAQGFIKLLEQVYTTGIPFNGNEVPAELSHSGKPELFYLNFIYQPLINENGETEGIIGAAIDVTETVVARKKSNKTRRN